ncbi:MAG: hypothetical protein COX61_01475 [Candidatus Brennerbacteria bacterium CG_4_10_14_0_2_um_filter_43_14]|nr:MAG: hypothetical protein COX61_01475 [Candidatus Brennerbacteria bacterium CG_4_10_14_0_2_um_filter_43_14]
MAGLYHSRNKKQWIKTNRPIRVLPIYGIIQITPSQHIGNTTKNQTLFSKHCQNTTHQNQKKRAYARF